LMQEARVNTECVKKVADEVGKFLQDSVSTEIVGIFRDTVGTASLVAELMAEVTCASDQQASAVEQINVAVGQMQQVTGNNAASAEESAAASEELSSQSVETLRAVSDLEVMVNGANHAREVPSGQSSRHAPTMAHGANRPGSKHARH
jgi:methyl-accepting chemotaxis protein